MRLKVSLKMNPDKLEEEGEGAPKDRELWRNPWQRHQGTAGANRDAAPVQQAAPREKLAKGGTQREIPNTWWSSCLTRGPQLAPGKNTDVLFPAAAASLTMVSDLPQESLVGRLIISLGDVNGKPLSQQGENRI